MARKKIPMKVQQQMSVHLRDYGWCRANAHNWIAQNDRALAVKAGGVEVHFVCANCEGHRDDNISIKTGELLMRKYSMPEGYVLQVKGTGEKRPTKNEWRRAHYRLLTKKG